MRGAALGLAVIALATLPVAHGAPMMAGAWAAGPGAYGHHSNSGDFVCPLAGVAFTHQLTGGFLALRASGAPQTFGQAVTDFANALMPCTLGTQAIFGAATFSGNPETGYDAYQSVDLGEEAGVTTEWLHVDAFTSDPVHLTFHAQTVGGPAPSAWWVEADLVQATTT